ncbi:unnamed protein product [Rotaria socialis]|uniref:ADP-ribosylation factor n=1 Tax=Rotaria socialis TaxID=392032 RepID=A0A817N6Z2_9BILA|nr:unnamed protein product [Rotaria socialis]CAF3203764.1 unnamed protein product [Rotaria socialis]CAF4246543.1 unnamed protein product [Rotaria socialis]CAF4277542.1 unnamed protein product [Rotaria socialis]
MGSFFSRLYDVFVLFGEEKSARILMLGLDTASKATILYKIKLDQNIQTIPTVGFNVEQVNPCRGVSFTVWDATSRQFVSQIDAMKPSEIIHKLGMNKLHDKHKWHVQSTCAITGDGLTDALLKMTNFVKQYHKENK